MSWWTGRLSRRELETKLRETQRYVTDLNAELEYRDQRLADANAALADWKTWGEDAQAELDAARTHVCGPAAAPTVLDVSRVDDPVYDAEIVEEQPALFFDQLGGRYLSKPRAHWMRTGMTTEIRLDDPLLQAALAEAEQNRAALPGGGS